MKRFFAFGCSFTRHQWPTYADFIAVNYDEYYNLARGGASNTYIMSRLVETDSLVNFNPETDFVIVMLSGFNRFSWLDNHKWRTNGDLHSWQFHMNRNTDEKASHERAMLNFCNEMLNDNWIIYQNWISVKAIKNILASKNIPHKILAGMNFFDNKDWDLSDLGKEKIQDIFNCLDVNTTLMDFKILSKDTGVKFKIGGKDEHPSIKTHHDFILNYLPDLYTNKIKDFYDSLNTRITLESIEKDKSIIEEIEKQYLNDLTHKLMRFGG